MFARLGSWCARRRGVVVVVWIGGLVAVGLIVGAVGSDVSTEFELPNVESRQGFETLEDNFGGFGAGSPGTIVFESENGFEDPAVVAEIAAFLSAVDELDDTTVTSPFAPVSEDPAAALAAMADFLGDDLDPAAFSGTSQISEDGTIAYADVELPGDMDQSANADFAEEVQALEPEIEGVRIEYGGQIFGDFEPPSSELLGLAFAIVILIVAFGSVLGMGLPIGVALGGSDLGRCCSCCCPTSCPCLTSRRPSV